MSIGKTYLSSVSVVGWGKRPISVVVEGGCYGLNGALLVCIDARGEILYADWFIRDEGKLWFALRRDVVAIMPFYKYIVAVFDGVFIQF